MKRMDSTRSRGDLSVRFPVCDDDSRVREQLRDLPIANEVGGLFSTTKRKRLSLANCLRMRADHTRNTDVKSTDKDALHRSSRLRPFTLRRQQADAGILSKESRHDC